MSHTPGPWEIDGAVTGRRAVATVWLEHDPEEAQRQGHGEGCIWITVDRHLIAIVPRGEGDPEADARLIASAPDLADALANLEEMSGWIITGLRSMGQPLSSEEEAGRAIAAARAALAKAKGQP